MADISLRPHLSHSDHDSQPHQRRSHLHAMLLSNVPARGISRLPTEILAMIFVCRASDHYLGHDGDHLSKTPPDWINVSYVCRHWRNVALSCPVLWAYVFVTSQRWTEELLARSKQTSLKIRLDLTHTYVFPGPAWLNYLEKVFDHLERIEELHLEFTCSCIHLVLPKLSCPAPRLQSLSLSVDGLDEQLEWISVLFDGNTPALRALELSGCVVPLRSFNPSSLTTLSLRCFPVPIQQTVEELFSTLRHMQALEHLHLEYALANATGFLSSASFHAFETINLPRLSRLLIAAPLLTIVAFFACTKIGLGAKIRLDPEPNSSLKNYTLLSALLSQRYSMAKDQARSPLKIRSLVISISAEGPGPTIAFSTSRYRYDDLLPIRANNLCCIPLEINLGELEIDSDHIIRQICCSVPSIHVRRLYARCPPFSPTFWRAVLGHLEGIRCIDLSSGYMPDLSVLSRPNQVDDRAQECILAPGLKKLDFSCMTFASGPDLSFGGGESLEKPALALDGLLKALATRRAPHFDISFVQCQIGNSDMFSMAASWGVGELCVFRVADSFFEEDEHEHEDNFDYEDDSDDEDENGPDDDNE